MSAWDPESYLKFHDERTQPSYDLAARTAIDSPATVVDLGCGPGNSTRVLRERWPGARVLGLDSSREMIEKAKHTCPQGEWVLADIADWRPDAPPDVLFTCATLQWLPRHGELIPRLYGFVRAGGALAVQVPANDGSPLHRALLDVSKRGDWKDLTAGCSEMITYHTPGFYYDLLSPLCKRLSLWQTIYLVVLNDQQGLIDWYASTGMRTYLERIPGEEEKKVFQRQVLDECRSSYPLQRDGKVLFPFKRLFLVAHK